jgi:hypothetical protein
MSWRTTGVLLVLLLLLGGYVWGQQSRETAPEEFEFDPFPTAPAQSDNVPLFPNLTAEAVTRLEIVDLRENFTVSFALEDDGRWYQTVPTRTEVITITMENHSRNLVNLTSRRVLPADANPPAAYGLDTPNYEIIVASQREDQVIRQRLFIGDVTVAGDAYYAQKLGDGRVYLAAAFSVENLLLLRQSPPHLP